MWSASDSDSTEEEEKKPDKLYSREEGEKIKKNLFALLMEAKSLDAPPAPPSPVAAPAQAQPARAPPSPSSSAGSAALEIVDSPRAQPPDGDNLSTLVARLRDIEARSSAGRAAQKPVELPALTPRASAGRLTPSHSAKFGESPGGTSPAISAADCDPTPVTPPQARRGLQPLTAVEYKLGGFARHQSASAPSLLRDADGSPPGTPTPPARIRPPASTAPVVTALQQAFQPPPSTPPAAARLREHHSPHTPAAAAAAAARPPELEPPPRPYPAFPASPPAAARKELSELPRGLRGVRSMAGVGMGCHHASRLLGKGAYGSVYHATEHTTGTAYALKRIERIGHPPDKWELLVKALRTEAGVLQSLNHENIVSVHGVAEVPDPADPAGIAAMEIKMELCDGTLDEFYLRGCNGEMHPVLVRSLIRDVARGLAYLHSSERGCVVHRDLKPQNILIISRSTGRAVAKLADFGACAVRTSLDAEGTTVMAGTKSWMAPEGFSGKSNAPADVFALALVLLALHGHQPLAELRGEFVPEMRFIVWAVSKAPYPMPPRDTVHPDAYDLAWRCLQVDPTRRPTAAQVLQHRYLTLSDDDIASAAPLSATARREAAAAAAALAAARAAAVAPVWGGGPVGDPTITL